MVQEELAVHEEEGEVVQTPAYEEEATKRVVFDYFGYMGRCLVTR